MTEPIIYYNSNSTTTNYAGTAVSLTKKELAIASKYTDLDLDNVWVMYGKYPHLRVFGVKTNFLRSCKSSLMRRFRWLMS